MRKFKINVNGKSYDVEVEEIEGGVFTPAPAIAPAPVASIVQTTTPVQVQSPVSAPAPQPVAPVAGSTNIVAPMPGSISDIKVAVGDTVSEGQVLIILEAMKMENEIMAPKAGKVVAVSVSKGESVDNGDLLVSLA